MMMMKCVAAADLLGHPHSASQRIPQARQGKANL